MKNRFLYIVVAFLFTITTGCSLFESPCGPEETAFFNLSTKSILDKSINHRSYLINSERVFHYSFNVNHVCTDENVKLEAFVSFFCENFNGIFARSSINWLSTFEQEIPLSKNFDTIQGEGEAELKQAFDDKEHGWFTAVLEIYFPTKGSYSLDSVFMKNNVTSLYLDASYKGI